MTVSHIACMFSALTLTEFCHDVPEFSQQFRHVTESSALLLPEKGNPDSIRLMYDLRIPGDDSEEYRSNFVRLTNDHLIIHQNSLISSFYLFNLKTGHGHINHFERRKNENPERRSRFTTLLLDHYVMTYPAQGLIRLDYLVMSGTDPVSRVMTELCWF